MAVYQQAWQKTEWSAGEYRRAILCEKSQTQKEDYSTYSPSQHCDSFNEEGRKNQRYSGIPWPQISSFHADLYPGRHRRSQADAQRISSSWVNFRRENGLN